jgi:hypothetical protein
VDASGPIKALHLIDASEAPTDYDHSAVVYEDMISEEEHDALVSDFAAKLRRCVESPNSPGSAQGEPCSLPPNSFEFMPQASV